MPKPSLYNKAATEFGGKVAETCIPQIRPVIDALPPEDIYSFWCGFIAGFAGMANATLPAGTVVQVLEDAIATARRNIAPPKEQLN